jgi:hypothetical protein
MKKINLALLFALVACSSPIEKKSSVKRRVASVAVALENEGELDRKVEKLTEGVFHSYLLGQVYLEEFDSQLDKNPDYIGSNGLHHGVNITLSYFNIFNFLSLACKCAKS